jgi:membrane protease YdiL (CAAX protease family)
MNDSIPISQIAGRKLWLSLLYSLGFLVILQLIRAGLDLAVSRLLPTDLNLRSEYSFLITFGGLTFIWLLVLRPSKSQLGLDLSGMSRTSRLLHISMAAILLLLFVWAAFIDLRLLAANLATALVLPIAEELIFRGYLWNKIETSLTGRWQQPLAWAITTALFALWHIGYVDAVAQNTPAQVLQESSLAFIMFTKVLIGGAVGFLAGLARWKSKSVYAAIFIHALWNTFGR